MAINIKEILHPSDSDSIKFEKVNYNFDQLLANGGGPQGTQGIKGSTGGSGATGVKGQKGELGIQGAKGEEGTATVLWGSVDNDATPVDTIILKPLPAGGSYTKTPTVWLGDVGYIPPGADGLNSAEARLTLSTGEVPDATSHFLRYYKDTNHILNVTNREDGTTTWFSTKKDLSSAGEVIGIEFEADKFKVDATGGNIVFNSTDNIKLNPGGAGGVIISRPVQITGYLNVESTSHVKIAAGTLAQRPTGAAGMIRYNSTDNRYEGHDGTIWRGLGGLIDTDQDTYIKAEVSPDEDILRFNVGIPTTLVGVEVATMGEDASDGYANSVEVFSVKRDQENKGDIIFDNDKGLLVKAKTATPGNNEAQPANEGSAKEFRRMDDYYYQESTQTAPSATSSYLSSLFVKDGAYAHPTNTDPYTSTQKLTFNPAPDPHITTDLLYVHKQQIRTQNPSGNGSTSVLDNTESPVAIAIDRANSRLSYVKTGHMVQCWGQHTFYAAPINVTESDIGVNMNGDFCNEDSADYGTYVSNQWSSPPDHLGGRIAFFFAEAEVFPYTNASLDWIYFPIPQRLNTTYNINQWNISGSNFEDYDFWGAIAPGANYFNIAMVHPSWGQDWWKHTKEKGDSYSVSTTDNVGKMRPHYMTLSDLRADTDVFALTAVPGTAQEAATTTINFNFSMPTEIRSYDTISTVRSLYTEEKFIPALAQNNPTR